MKTKWCHNAKTGEIFEYTEYPDGDTDFPRGTFLVYQDYLTTGFKNESDARAWSEDWHACSKCKSARKGAVGTPCNFCGTPLQ